MSQIDSYSYLLKFHFMNIIPICEYCNLTNIIPTHKYLSKCSWLSFLYQIYIKSIHTSHYGCICMVNLSKEKFIRLKKIKFLEKKLVNKIYFRYLWIICDYFPSDKYHSYSYSQVLEFTNWSYSSSYRSWLRKSIPIPIIGKNNYSLIIVTEEAWMVVFLIATLWCLLQYDVQYSV